MLVAEWSAPRYTRELLLIAPLLLAYTLMPPGEPIVRYLVPVLPALIAIFVRYIEKDLKIQHSNRALLVSIGLTYAFGAATLSSTSSEGSEHVMMAGLAQGMNKQAETGDGVLLYDVQSQYYMNTHCYGLAGNVGSDMADVLLRRTSITDFILDREVRFVVVSDQLGERPLYENTLLSDLHTLDPTIALADTLTLDGMVLRKEFSNPEYIRRYAAMQSLYGGSEGDVSDASSTLAHAAPRWNSVYRVLGNELAVEAERQAMLTEQAAAMTPVWEDPSAIQEMLDSASESDPFAASTLPADSMVTGESSPQADALMDSLEQVLQKDSSSSP